MKKGRSKISSGVVPKVSGVVPNRQNGTFQNLGRPKILERPKIWDVPKIWNVPKFWDVPKVPIYFLPISPLPTNPISGKTHRLGARRPAQSSHIGTTNQHKTRALKVTKREPSVLKRVLYSKKTVTSVCEFSVGISRKRQPQRSEFCTGKSEGELPSVA